MLRAVREPSNEENCLDFCGLDQSNARKAPPGLRVPAEHGGGRGGARSVNPAIAGLPEMR